MAKFQVTNHSEQMLKYATTMNENNYTDALKCLSEMCSKTLADQMKKDTVVCLMVDDPDNLGAALVCHFLLSVTSSSGKSMK